MDCLSPTIGQLKRRPDELIHPSLEEVKMRRHPHIGVIFRRNRV